MILSIQQEIASRFIYKQAFEGFYFSVTEGKTEQLSLQINAAGKKTIFTEILQHC